MPISTAPIFTVGQINTQIKYLLEHTFPAITVRGELKEAKIAGRNNHLYGKLTDETGTNNLSIVIWNSNLQRLNVRPESLIGQQVLAKGQVSSFPGRGDIQLNVTGLEPVGAGTQLMQLELLKQKLAAEGLFDRERKRALPEFPKNIAVITSDTGAAIHDIAVTLAKRYPLTAVYLFPAQVQGVLAVNSICQALDIVRQQSKKLSLDILIIGRGGGGTEDLSAFNNEQVVRSVAGMPIPVVSAVGHEINRSLVDFAADCYAPTPTGAATIVSPDSHEISSFLAQGQRALNNNIKLILIEAKNRLIQKEVSLQGQTRKRLATAEQHLDFLAGSLEKYNPARQLWARQADFAEHANMLHESIDDYLHERTLLVADLHNRLSAAINNRLARDKQALQMWCQRLEDLAPERVMERGYAILLDDKRHQVVLEGMTSGAKITALVKGGSLEATVDKVNH